MLDIFMLLGAYIGVFALFLLIVTVMTVISVFGGSLISKFLTKK